MLLRDKVAVVTGAGGGIGRKICEAYLAEGAKVVGLDVSFKDGLGSVDERLLDVTSFEDCEAMCEAIERDYGRVDVLVACAGITRDALTRKMTEAQFDEVVGVNLKGVWNVVRFFGPGMQQRKSGSIISISSVVGEQGNIGQSNYAATKAAVIGMTKTWAKEFSFRGGNVRVNAIAPGYVLTDMLKGVPEELLRRFEGQTMLGRLGEPEEIAQVAVFLASDMSSYVTGTVIDANGGMRL